MEIWGPPYNCGFPSGFPSNRPEKVALRNHVFAFLGILWMDEILHHLRDPGMMIPLQITTTVMVSDSS